MESAKIKVTRRNGETIVSSDKGPEFKFGEIGRASCRERV